MSLASCEGLGTKARSSETFVPLVFPTCLGVYSYAPGPDTLAVWLIAFVVCFLSNAYPGLDVQQGWLSVVKGFIQAWDVKDQPQQTPFEPTNLNAETTAADPEPKTKNP